VKSSTAGPSETEFHRASSPQAAPDIDSIPDTRYQIPDTIHLDTVKENWQSILGTAKELNASLTLALTTARPIETTGNTITIAVKYPFHKERLDELSNQLTLARAFDKILKTKTSIRIVLENNVPSPSLKADEAIEASEAPILNPLINQAMEMLGGKLVNES
jgi:hypothetical protein